MWLETRTYIDPLTCLSHVLCINSVVKSPGCGLVGSVESLLSLDSNKAESENTLALFVNNARIVRAYNLSWPNARHCSESL